MSKVCAKVRARESVAEGEDRIGSRAGVRVSMRVRIGSHSLADD